MSEQKTRETLEAEWWDKWWRRDYSWDGLKSRGLGGDYLALDTKGPNGEVNLQEYWRRDPETGQIRNDDAMIDAGELVVSDDGILWHVAHVPLKWKSEQPAKQAWSGQQQQQLHDILERRVRDTAASNGGIDGRAQFSGIVVNNGVIFEKSKEDTGTPSIIRLTATNAWFGHFFAKSALFSEEVNLSETFIMGFAEFSQSHFGKNFIAEFGHFCGRVSFENAVFEKKAVLRGSTFLENTNFDRAAFKHEVDFQYGLFRNRVTFQYTVFSKKVDFFTVEFLGKVHFSNASFEEDVSLIDTKFHDDPLFDGVNFNGAARFNRTLFMGVPFFVDTKFCDSLTFIGSVFSKGACFRNIKAWGRDLYGFTCEFYDAKSYHSLYFQRSPLPPISAFHGLKLDKGALLSFDDPGPKATLASFNEQLSRIKEKLKNSPQSGKNEALEEANRLLDDLAGGCRVLKNYFESQGDRERTQRFFRLELEARMKSDEVGRLERLIFWAYKVLSDYGASIGRPLKWLASSVVFFWLSYWFIAATCINPSLSHIKPNQESYSIQTVSEVMNHVWTRNFSEIDTRPMLGALSFSAHRTFPFGAWDVKAEDKDNNIRKLLLGDGEGGGNFTVRVLATVQSIFSLAMIFLSGLAIRRRFKMD